MACKVETIMKKIAPSEYIDRTMLEAYIKQELNGGAKTSIDSATRSKNAEAVKKLLVSKPKTKSKKPVKNTAKSSGFQGYVGGFDSKGKGTPEGDGKDKAMREVADGFIGELAGDVATGKPINKSSSTYTSAKELTSDRNIRIMLGDGFVPVSSDIEKTNKIIMLGRNSERKGTELGIATKNEIDFSNKNGATFVVGDMPGVDTQFIEYLDEIGASYKVYHTGTTPRIKKDVTESKDTSSIYEKLGDRTVSGNVLIEKVYQKEGIAKAKEIGGVFSLRVNNSDKHFGNPFSAVEAEIAKGLTRTKNTKESVEKYIDWVINSNDTRAVWIRSVLDSGKLKGKPIIYYKELGEPSHATALDYMINNWESVKPSETVKTVKEDINEQYEKDLIEFAKEHGIDVKLRNDVNLAVDTIKGKATGAYYKNGVVHIPNYEGVLKSKKLLADLDMLYSDVEAFAKKAKNWDAKTNMKVHEIWHALTVDYLDSGKAKQLDKDLETLFEAAKKELKDYNVSGAKNKDGKPYWHTNSREFLAVMLAEPKMLEKLNTVKYKGNVTLAQKILTTLFKIIEAATGVKLDSESMAGELIRIAGASAKSSPKSSKAYNQAESAIMPGINGKAKLDIKIC